MFKSTMMLLALVSSVGFAKGVSEILNEKVANSDKIDGCGLGWQVTESRTMIGTTTRGTTNMTVPASFGMTSGTLGCEQIGFAAKDQQAAKFVASNFHTLKSELAEGQGEYAGALMNSLGCNAAQANEVQQNLKRDFNNAVAPAQDAVQLFHSIKKNSSICG